MTLLNGCWWRLESWPTQRKRGWSKRSRIFHHLEPECFAHCWVEFPQTFHHLLGVFLSPLERSSSKLPRQHTPRSEVSQPQTSAWQNVPQVYQPPGWQWTASWHLLEKKGDTDAGSLASWKVLALDPQTQTCSNRFNNPGGNEPAFWGAGEPHLMDTCHGSFWCLITPISNVIVPNDSCES